MRAKELIAKTPATYNQLVRWREQGINIGTKPKGSGYPCEYTDVDVKVATVLAGLSSLIGSGPRTPSYAKVMKKVATQVRREPSIADRDHIYVSTNGLITETPKSGWVV